MPFIGRVAVTPCTDERWEVLEDFTYMGQRDAFTVPKGFTTDFASVPRPFTWLLPRYGKWTHAAVLHDWLWEECRRQRSGGTCGTPLSFYDADGIFVRAMRELGVPFMRRWTMWAAVRWAAVVHDPGTWFERGPSPVLRMLAISAPAAAFVAVPGLVVLGFLLIGVAGEWVAYLPLRLFRRTPSKQLNRPRLGEALSS